MRYVGYALLGAAIFGGSGFFYAYLQHAETMDHAPVIVAVFVVCGLAFGVWLARQQRPKDPDPGDPPAGYSGTSQDPHG